MSDILLIDIPLICLDCRRRQPTCRGVCSRCHRGQQNDIVAGRTTDTDLVRRGKRLRAQKKGLAIRAMDAERHEVRKRRMSAIGARP